MTCTSDCHKPHGRQAHCGACHRTFGGVSTFDVHRRNGDCALPEAWTERNGIWGHHGSRPTGTWTKEKK